MNTLLRVAVEELGHIPLVRELLKSAYRVHFDRAHGHRRMFCGVYPDFETALQHIPRGWPMGYDNDPSASRLLDERGVVFSCDYPILFWLLKLQSQIDSIFDWGGNVGISYFSYKPYLKYSNHLRWIVDDVPAVVDLGRKIAAEERAAGLSFTTEFASVAEVDLLLAAGSLQFIEDPYEVLHRARRLPRHFLINKLPVYEQPSAVTLQNMGTAIMPYRLFNRAEFVGELERLGYRLIDSWTNADLGCSIPFHGHHSIRAYRGFYFAQNEYDMAEGCLEAKPAASARILH